MTYDIVTIFPEFFAGPFEHGILRRAREQGLIHIGIHDLRGFTTDKHHTVDDRPFGGGEGMVFKPEPLFAAVEGLLGGAERPPQTEIILLSAQGKLLTQALAQELSTRERLILLCGRYEGVDERVAEHLATLELSIGDYVLTGGELAAAVVVDVVTRLLPKALGHERSTVEESFGAHPEARVTAGGILDCPHWTRPAEFRGHAVPEVLVSGDHEEVARWRRRRALEKTWRNRPELLERAELNEEDRAWVEKLKKS
ncbi:MAG: tRNA (guanosine(37)-N1)-methyltransferase TrmD [Candidatus Acidiferrales bacterium]